MESETKLPQIASNNNFHSTGNGENDQLMNSQNLKTLAIVKKARKQVEDDARLLANRIALLKQEEIKTLKKIEETKKKALEIYNLKKKNEERTKMKGVVKEKQMIELKEKTQQQRQFDKQQKEEKLQIFEEHKQKHVDQIRKMKEMQKRKRLYQKNKQQEELLLRHQIVNQQKFLGRQKYDEFYQNRVKLFMQQNEKQAEFEENYKQRKEQEILRMEKLEMELITKLQTSQLLQKHAYEELENALTLPANEFASKYLGKKKGHEDQHSSNEENQHHSDNSQLNKYNSSQSDIKLKVDGEQANLQSSQPHDNKEQKHHKEQEQENHHQKQKEEQKPNQKQHHHEQEQKKQQNHHQQEALVAKSSFPIIKSKHSLAHKYVTEQFWNQYKDHKTHTSQFTLLQCIQVSIELDNQHVGIYAGDSDCYRDFKEVFTPLILDYHKLKSDFTHTPNMDYNQITIKIEDESPIESTRIRVARNIEGYGLSPGITKQQRLDVEELARTAFAEFQGDLQGQYYPLLGMDENVRQQLVDDHFLFMNGDANLRIAGMERDWPEGRGIFHNENKTALVWVNEEDQLRIISMQKGGNVNEVFERLANLIQNVEQSIQQKQKKFQVHDQFGYLTSCPSNLGSGMRASVHVHLPGWLKEGSDKLNERCQQLGLQPRGARGESGGDTGDLFDISNKYRLGYSEVDLVKMMIEGVNTIIKEDKELQAKHAQ